MEIKDVLYQAIAEYQEKHIVSDIAQGNSTDTINAIFEYCSSKLSKNDYNKSETRGSLAEGLIHYLLTIAMMPSQRKTTCQSVDLDIVMPDTKTLESSPKDAIVISFPKTNEPNAIKNRIDNLKKIQHNPENIWVVTDTKVPLDAKIYSLDDSNFTFSNILNDLISFSSNRKQSKLKIFKI